MREGQAGRVSRPRPRGDVTEGDRSILKMASCFGGVPRAWKKAGVTSSFRKGEKEEAGNYRPVRLASISGKATGL